MARNYVRKTNRTYKKPVGRKKVGISEPTPEMLEEISEMARCGMTQEQVAGYFRMAYSTWFDRCAEYPQLSNAYFQGKTNGIKYVASKLLELVEKGNERAIMFYLEVVAKWVKASAQVAGKGGEDGAGNKQPVTIIMTDPVEASRIYQAVMMGEKGK